MKHLLPVIFLVCLVIFPRGSAQDAPTRSDGSAFLRPCYFTSWAQYRPGRGQYSTTNYIPGLCTHILYAFATFKADFTMKADDPTDLVGDDGGPGQYQLVNNLKNQQPGLKTLLSIGGGAFGTAQFQKMSFNKTTRTKFINSAVGWVRKYNFDGIDIDWEFPLKKDQKYIAVLQELRAAINAEAQKSGKDKLLLTVAVTSTYDTMPGYDIVKMGPLLDFVNVMTYDFWYPSVGTTGMNAPLYNRTGLGEPAKFYNVVWAANAWHNWGIPKEKVIVGIAPYAHGWTLKNASKIQPGSTGNTASPALKFSQEKGAAAYYEICEMLAAGAKRYWHAQHEVPWLIQNNKQWYSYDDAESVELKMDFIKDNDFGGAFVWTLDLDDFNGKCSNGNGTLYPIIGTIARELGGVDI
ncbi:unnamed protein product, partial [Mesorhabditis spiculigera]